MNLNFVEIPAFSIFSKLAALRWLIYQAVGVAGSHDVLKVVLLGFFSISIPVSG